MEITTKLLDNSILFTKFYKTWANMVQRCNNPKNTDYKNYGGRGISISQDWLKYKNFENDMYEEYGYLLEIYGEKKVQKYITLDRINNNSNYCKENCRWVDMKLQANNRRKKLSTL